MSIDAHVTIGRYTNQAYAEAVVEALREIGVVAVVIPSDVFAGPWDVTVPAGDSVHARLVAEGFLDPDSGAVRPTIARPEVDDSARQQS